MKLVFAGTSHFSLPALQKLIDSKQVIVAVYTQPDRLAGRGRKIQQSPVKQLAESHGITVIQPDSLSAPSAITQFKSLDPDLMIVVAYGQILSPTALNIPRHGCLNIHASLLPRWRGAAPIQRAILAGDTQTGVTIMQMETGLDTGDILKQVTRPIATHETSGQIHDDLAQTGANALLEVIDLINHDKLRSQVQNHAKASYAHRLEKSHAHINWHRPAIEVLRAIKAFNPWPVAYTSFHGQPLRIWNAKLIEHEHIKASAGQVITIGPKGLGIACGQGGLQLLEVQPAGKPRMSAPAFIHSRKTALAGYQFE